MYIFLSADGKIAYLYDDVIFIGSSDYFLYQKYVYRKAIKKGVKIIIFKAFRLKILLLSETGGAVFIKNSKIYSRKISRVLKVKAVL